MDPGVRFVCRLRLSASYLVFNSAAFQSRVWGSPGEEVSTYTAKSLGTAVLVVNLQPV